MPRFAQAHEIRAAHPTVDNREWVRLSKYLKSCEPSARSATDNLTMQIRAAIWAWLTHLSLTSDNERQHIINRMNPEILSFAATLKASLSLQGKLDKTNLPVLGIEIVPASLVRWSLWNRWYDFIDDHDVLSLPEPPVTRIIGDVTAMFCRMHDRIIALRNSTDASRPISDSVSGHDEE